MYNNNKINHQGFTLLEFLVVVAIMGITLAIGLPSFQSFINNNRLTSSANDMVTALNYARSEAIKQTQTIGVSINMSAGTWEVYKPGDPSTTIQTYAASKNVKIDVNGSNICLTPNYKPDGRLADTQPVAVVFSIDGSSEQRTVNILLSGKINVTKS